MKQTLKLAATILLVGSTFTSCKKTLLRKLQRKQQTPIANVGADPITILPKDSMFLDGSASTFFEVEANQAETKASMSADEVQFI